MKSLPVLACTAFALAGCATLPDAPSASISDPSAVAALQDLVAAPAARLSFCETNAGQTSCAPNSAGLKASGLGGVFLPLDSTLTSATFRQSEADFNIDINGLAAACASTPPQVDVQARKITASGFFCNWAGVGNVLATVELTADWQDAGAQAFGGRYRIQFNGTGNGAGSGTFRAQVQR